MHCARRTKAAYKRGPQKMYPQPKHAPNPRPRTQMLAIQQNLGNNNRHHCTLTKINLSAFQTRPAKTPERDYCIPSPSSRGSFNLEMKPTKKSPQHKCHHNDPTRSRTPPNDAWGKKTQQIQHTLRRQSHSPSKTPTIGPSQRTSQPQAQQLLEPTKSGTTTATRASRNWRNTVAGNKTEPDRQQTAGNPSIIVIKALSTQPSKGCKMREHWVPYSMKQTNSSTKTPTRNSPHCHPNIPPAKRPADHDTLLVWIKIEELPTTLLSA